MCQHLAITLKQGYTIESVALLKVATQRRQAVTCLLYTSDAADDVSTV